MPLLLQSTVSCKDFSVASPGPIKFDTDSGWSSVKWLDLCVIKFNDITIQQQTNVTTIWRNCLTYQLVVIHGCEQRWSAATEEAVPAWHHAAHSGSRQSHEYSWHLQQTDHRPRSTAGSPRIPTHLRHPLLPHMSTLLSSNCNQYNFWFLYNDLLITHYVALLGSQQRTMKNSCSSFIRSWIPFPVTQPLSIQIQS